MASHLLDQAPLEIVLRSIRAGLAWILVLLLSSCTALQKTAQPTDDLHVVAEDTSRELMNIFAPVFVIPEWQQPYNQIGMVVANIIDGRETISINPGQPTFYVDSSSFSTQRSTYINLIYRVHFQKTPFSLIPFHFGAGSNVGLLVIVTLNKDHVPLLVTVANTCGCYAVVIPTAALPAKAYPEDWVDKNQYVYGEVLPASLPLYGEDDVLLITVRPEVHRLMSVTSSRRKTLKKKRGAASEINVFTLPEDTAA